MAAIVPSKDIFAQLAQKSRFQLLKLLLNIPQLSNLQLFI